MSRKKMFRNTIAIILTALIGLMLPVQVFATTLPKDEKIYSSFDDVQGNTEITGNIVTEISDERSETTKEFLLDDGTKLIAEYDQPIHYKDDSGNWVEYDNSLVSATATADEANTEYSVKNSDVDVKLSNKAKSNNMIKITSNDYSISWGYDKANKSKINIIENNEALVGNEEFTTLKNITQEAVYEDVYKNVDLQYFISSTEVKENIILKSSDVQNEFNLTYKINNLTAKQIDDYTITLYNKENEVVYKILSPYMTDAKGNSSNQLKLEITSQKGSNLNVKLTADYWFIKSLGRSFPITIDPELTNKLTSKLTMNQNINNTVVSYGPYYTSSNGYIVAKINSLPTLGDGEKIISAKFNFEATNGSTLFTSENDTPIIINAHKLTSIVSNVSQYDTTVLDYDSLTYNDNKNLTFDLTKTLNDWYDNGDEIDGFVLEAFDTVGSKQVNLQHSTVSSLTPSFTIIYKDFTGTESNLTYHTVPVGYNATAEVSDYLGNLVITQNLYEGTGSRMPVTLTATYNSINYDKTFANGSPSGYGWQFSFNQYVRDAGEDLAEAGYDYIYTDADGTDHYLKKSDDAEEWYDEDGLGITLTKTDTNILIDDGTITQTYELTTAGGKLLSEKDEHDNTINYTYTDGNLTSITDGSKCEENNNVGREFNFVYYTTSDGAKRVRYIVLPDANRIYFYYTSTARDKISYILFPDNRITRFTYSEDERIVAVEQAILTTSTGIVTNSKVAFTYNTKAQISNITEYGSDNSEGNYLGFVYGNDNTTQVSDRYARSVTYTFDNQGNQISVLNANGYLENNDSSGLTVTSGADSYTKNYISHSTEHGEIGEYYFKEDGTKENLTSTGGTVTIDTSDYSEENGCVQYFGSTSIKINNPVTEDNSAFFTKAKHQFNDTSFNGKYVTFSAYVKTKDVEQIYSDGAIGATLAIECFNENGEKVGEATSVGITDTTDWQRLSVSILVPSDTAYFTVYCNLRNASGTAWFDCLQLEDGNSVNDFNALQNGDFEVTDNSGWLTNENQEVEIQDNTVVINGEAGAYEDETTAVEEDSVTEEVQPETYCVTEPVPTEFDSIITYDDYGNTIKTQQGMVEKVVKKTYEVESSDTETDDETNSDETTEDNTTTENPLGNKYIYQNVNVDRAGVIFNIVGEAQAKSVPLSNENRTFGIALNIYYEGNTTPETHYQEFNSNIDEKQTVSLSVFPENDNQVIDYIAFAFVYGYNENTMTVHSATLNISATSYSVSETSLDSSDTTDNETSDTTEEDNYIDYEVISETLDTTQLYMETSSVYDNTGSYVTAETDEAGNTVTYTYDVNGNVTSVTDGNENVVNYTYDAGGNVTQIKSYDAQNDYSYNGAGLISAIDHNSFRYQFNYNVYNNLISTAIGDNVIATNTYNNHNGLLKKTTYANGDYVEYLYDVYDNLLRIIGENGVIVTFVYNKKGLVSKVNDYQNALTTYYYYDFNGSVTGEYRQSDEGKLSYYLSYDNNGNQVEKTSINGYVKTITNGTDEDGNAYVSNDGITVDSTTDDFGRTTEVKTSRGEGNSVFFTNYEYANVGTTNATTNLVSKLTQKYGNDELVNYEYTYDGNGNISSIKQNGTEVARYSYDELNQLTWSADTNTGLYTEISYDNAGNITSVKEYGLSTTSWSPLSLISEKTYSYTDTDWKDKLTAYNGTTIDYDANGNPLNYRDGMTFTWENGRVLESITTGTATLEMKYDYNSMRTQKKVGNVVTNYYYDSNNNLIGLSCGDNTLFFYYDNNGTPTSFAHNGTMYYYVKNQLGDIAQITKQDGTVVAKYVYDAWGKILSIKDGSNNTIDSTNLTDIANLNPFRYRGYVYDSETGLYYLQSRYYDPIVGRFLNADSYADTGNSVLSSNMFSCCENNPVFNVDFNGKWIKRTWKEVKKYINLGIHYGHSIIRRLGVNTAGIGAWFLQMKKDRYGIYHATFNCWQQYFGYNDLYDIVFEIGTSMESKKYTFSYNRKSYVIWAWKGDYINLGAGAEVGIYTGGPYHWNVDKSLALPMSMILKYKNTKIIDYYSSKAWWLTGFNPKYQNVKALNLSVEFTIDFNKQKSLYHAFYQKYKWNKNWRFIYYKFIGILKF